MGNPQGLNVYAYGYNNPLKFNDPDGHCPNCVAAGIGALLGGAVDYGVQVVSNVRQNGMSASAFTNVDVKEVAVAAAGGAVAGFTFGAATAVVGTGFGGTLLAGGVSSVAAGQAGRATENVLNDRPVTQGLGNPREMARDAAIGVAGAAVGYGLGKAIEAVRAPKTICSFSAETSVATEDGPRAISALHVGDHVLAFDETIGATDSYTVTAVMMHDDHPLIEYLTIDSERLETTPEHPFFTQEQGWIPAGDLWPGAHIRRANGSYGEVQFFMLVPQHEEMYNLTVEQAHTFFVGTQKWLVHNACPNVQISTVAPDWAQKGAHIKVNGVELAVRPGEGGRVVFRPVFSSTSAKEARAAIKQAEAALKNPEFRQQLADAAQRATDYLGKGDAMARARSTETNFLVKALKKLGAE